MHNWQGYNFSLANYTRYTNLTNQRLRSRIKL